jgi:hypothetical protein
LTQDVFGDAAIAPVPVRVAPCRTIGIARAVRLGAGGRGCLCPTAVALSGSQGTDIVARLRREQPCPGPSSS